MWKWSPIAAMALAVTLTACSGKDAARDTDDAGRAASEQPAANNTGVNERDRSQEMPTPMDQGNSEMDRGITQRIRQQLMAEESLSLDAKNIKIITNERVVVLRGPVDSEAEKTHIGQLAESTADVVQVMNLLDIKGPATE